MTDPQLIAFIAGIILLCGTCLWINSHPKPIVNEDFDILFSKISDLHLLLLALKKEVITKDINQSINQLIESMFKSFEIVLKEQQEIYNKLQADHSSLMARIDYINDCGGKRWDSLIREIRK